MRVAERIDRLVMESAFDVLLKARALEAAGRSIIHLELGEPDFNTPGPIISAAKQALDEGWTHYGPPQGLQEFREAIAQHVSRTRKIQVDAKNVCVTPGAKPMLFYPMLALVEAGDEVLYPDPGFPIYRSLIQFLGAKGVPMPLLEENGFSLDLNLLEDRLNERTRLIILNSPQNPTGGVVPEADIRRLAELVRERDVMILSDEIYSRICYEGEEFSIASVPGMLEKTIIVDGFSKSHAMTGWRLGYGVVPDWLVKPMNLLVANANTCTASFVQRAAITGLEGPQDEVEAMVREFRRRRDMFCPALDRVPGLKCSMPAGAFYAFVNGKETGLSSRALEDVLLNEAGVACLDGGAFGPHGEGYVRMSYANSFENLQEAVERIAQLAQKNFGR